MKNRQEISSQLVGLVAHVERICEEHGLLPPFEISVTDACTKVREFDYSSEWKSVDLLHVALKRPITLRLRDAEGSFAELQITGLTLRPEWIHRFLQ